MLVEVHFTDPSSFHKAPKYLKPARWERKQFRLAMAKGGMEDDLAAAAQKWRKELLAKWKPPAKQSATFKHKLLDACRRGIPPAVRSEAWQTLVGNDLRINTELFEVLRSRADEIRFVTEREDGGYDTLTDGSDEDNDDIYESDNDKDKNDGNHVKDHAEGSEDYAQEASSFVDSGTHALRENASVGNSDGGKNNQSFRKMYGASGGGTNIEPNNRPSELHLEEVRTQHEDDEDGSSDIDGRFRPSSIGDLREKLRAEAALQRDHKDKSPTTMSFGSSVTEYEDVEDEAATLASPPTCDYYGTEDELDDLTHEEVEDKDGEEPCSMVTAGAVIKLGEKHWAYDNSATKVVSSSLDDVSLDSEPYAVVTSSNTRSGETMTPPSLASLSLSDNGQGFLERSEATIANNETDTSLSASSTLPSSSQVSTSVYKNDVDTEKGSHSGVTKSNSNDSKTLTSTPPNSSRMVTRKSSLTTQIELDLSRTFPTLAFFDEGGGPFRQALQDILEAFSQFRPGLGYVQGMSHVAAMFLLYMDRDAAFVCFCNLLQDHQFYQVLRSKDLDLLPRYIRFFDDLLLEHIPHLHEHFNRLDLRPDMYIVNWLLTLFTKTIDLDAAARIWDCYLFYDTRERKERFLWRACLALLKTLDVQLRLLDFDAALGVLRRAPRVFSIEKFFFYLDSTTISARHYQALRKKVGLNEEQLTASSTQLAAAT